MKDYNIFFVLFSLLELLFTGCYILIARSVDATVIVSGIIYLAGMVSNYFAFRVSSYKKKRSLLVDGLISP